ncbi:MAG TPA: hypothetical protein VL221_11970 [Bacteroidota bacterium]|nr:hypothetical protein [Bacteroidota bacterium]
MKSKGHVLCAVITGDVVDSSALPAPGRRRLLRVMEESSRVLRKALGPAVPLDVDVFRGDSWQVYIADPALGLRAALLFRAALRERMESHTFDTRLAIGIGTADIVPRVRVSRGVGEAFRASGLALDALRKRRMAVAFPSSDAEGSLDVLAHLVDGIAVHWSDRQARAVVGAMQGWTQARIASSWKPRAITQQAAALHLEAAGWRAVERGLGEFERIVAGAEGLAT